MQVSYHALYSLSLVVNKQCSHQPDVQALNVRKPIRMVRRYDKLNTRSLAHMHSYLDK